MVRPLVILAGLVICVSTSNAQVTSAPAPHQHPTVVQSPVIDGATNPELIPDSLAYRLYFVAVSTAQNPSDDERKRQRTHLAKTGLADSEQEALVAVLTDFRSNYDALIAQYNEAAKAALAHNQAADISTLLNALDGLVQTTRDKLTLRLSPGGRALLHAFVISEKKSMRLQ